MSSDEIEIPRKYKGPLPISTKKYKGLNELCSKLAIPREFNSFYKNLMHGNLSNCGENDAAFDYRGESDNEC